MFCRTCCKNIQVKDLEFKYLQFGLYVGIFSDLMDRAFLFRHLKFLNVRLKCVSSMEQLNNVDFENENSLMKLNNNFK